LSFIRTMPHNPYELVFIMCVETGIGKSSALKSQE